MSNLHRDYKTEHDGVKIIETSEGFVTYRMQGDTLLFMELYVDPAERSRGKAIELTHKIISIAAELGARQVIATIDPNDKNIGALAGALTKAGMKKTGKIQIELDTYEVDVCRG